MNKMETLNGGRDAVEKRLVAVYHVHQSSIWHRMDFRGQEGQLTIQFGETVLIPEDGM